MNRLRKPLKKWKENWMPLRESYNSRSIFVSFFLQNAIPQGQRFSFPFLVHFLVVAVSEKAIPKFPYLADLSLQN